MVKLKEIDWQDKKSAVARLMEEPTVKDWISSIDANTEGGISNSTRYSYPKVLRRFCVFLTSGSDEDKELTLEDLIEEGRASRMAIPTKLRINRFFYWLQGEQMEGYKPPKKPISPNSARIYAYGVIRGFFTHNGVSLGKFSTPKMRASKVSTTDLSVELIILDPDTNKMQLNKELIRRFYNKLNFRDKVIFTALLSGGGNDVGDLLDLTVGYIRNQWDKENIYWQGNRNKTGFPFRVFFSREATRLLKEYTEERRSDAEDSDLLFITELKPTTYTRKRRFRSTDDDPTDEVITVGGKLKGTAVNQAFKKAAEELGYKNNNSQNPFRSKRLRHLFNTLARDAGVDQGVLAVFQGHSTTVSQDYMERGKMFLFSHYQKVENLLEIEALPTDPTSKRVEQLEIENKYLKQKLTEQEEKFGELEGFVKQTIIETQKDMEKMREEFCKSQEDRKEDVERVKELRTALVSKVNKDK